MDAEHLLHCPKLDTEQVPKNIIKLYWDTTAMITSPPSAEEQQQKTVYSN